MKIAVACDHGGFALKDALIDQLKALGCEVLDLGAHQFDKDDDYPDFSRYVGQAIQHHQAERGIIICGSGVGAAVAANKLRGVRAGLCHDTYSAAQCVEHDDVNVLCLGARVVGDMVARELVRAFVSAKFTGEERHARRLEKVNALEAAG
jgi:ribose 5-phosphate isomerase B